MSRALVVLVVVVLASGVLALGACGKKGPPSAPGPADQIIYPHPYPSR
jgi:predicted small lipoprotein YifL